MSRSSTPVSGALRIRWGRVAVALILLLALVYVAVIALTPVPAPAAVLDVEAEQQFDLDAASAQAVVDAQPLPTAVAWQDGDEVWANTDEAMPIASISKIVTVLVAQEAQPLEPGADGRTHVWTQEDAGRQAAYLAEDGIAFPIPVGTEVTERQMLTLALLPSANDFAAAYAYSVFGDNEAFVAAVEEWGRRNGLDSLTIVEPTGMDGRNAANPGDLVRIARLALADPAITEFTRMKTAVLPWGIGEVDNTNVLLRTLPGTIGLKTGRSNVAGFALLAAQQGKTADGSREVVKIAATLDRPSSEARAGDTTMVLTALDPLPQTVEVIAAEERIGTATTAAGDTIPLLADGGAEAVLLPGEAARRTVELTALGPGPKGGKAGSVLVSSPTGDSEVAVVTGAAIEQPGFWWKLTHPNRLFVSP